jgi:hypothetical protein
MRRLAPQALTLEPHGKHALQPSPSRVHVLRCAQCGDVIGVYEPLILVTNGSPRATSLASDPAVSRAPGEPYHRACYDTMRDDAPSKADADSQ